MKILQIQKFFYLLGGGSRYFFEVSKLLKRHNHELAYFAMESKENSRSKWSKYFVSNLSFEDIDYRNGIRILSRMFYSVEARRKISQLLDSFKPDIVHLYDIYHHISSSIILELHKRNIPIVQRFGDYHFIAPNYNLFHDGAICEITKRNKFYKAIFHKCIKKSYLAGIAEVIEKYFNYWNNWNKNYVDYFIVPSQFIKSKFIEYGVQNEKIFHLPNLIDSNKYKPRYGNGNYILYFGRLSPEKGINYLIDAMKLLPNIKLKIVGRGSQEQELRSRKHELHLSNVEFVGFRDGFELKRLIADSRFTILPSVWYEVFGLSILESFASGKPMVASNIGGIPETVKDGYNGFLFEPGNVEDCVEKINKLWNNPSLCRKLGRNAQEYVEKNFGPEEHYEKLMEIYKKAINLHK